MSSLSSTVRRLASARSDESRISAFWSYFGSFGDDFFSEDDDSSDDGGQQVAR
ncbi:MAG: hypothetical protein JWM12_4055 [Ilumatobacteraceae bacterium]|jgi:hypothetical protein|nr:hypothetical protein [Ilumatobacteraceae bacterium]